MKKIQLILIIVVLFLASPLFAQSIQDQLEELEQEENDIQEGYDALNTDIGKYNIIESNLESELSTNEVKRTSLANKITEMNSEKENLDRDCAYYDSNCANRIFYFDRGEEQLYNDCVALKSSLDSRISSYNSKYGGVDNEVANFNYANDQLNQRITIQKNALAELDNRENKLKARKTEADRKYQQIINSPAFQQLINGENISQKCKDMAEQGDLEGACHCLQVFWDGAN